MIAYACQRDAPKSADGRARAHGGSRALLARLLGSSGLMASGGLSEAWAQAAEAASADAPDVTAAFVFAGVAGAIAVACALGTARLWRKHADADAEAKRLRRQLDADLSEERVFLFRKGHLLPASPATVRALNAHPVKDRRARRARLRAMLGDETVDALAEKLGRLTEPGDTFTHTAPDADGRSLTFYGSRVGPRTVLRFWPAPEGLTPPRAPEPTAPSRSEPDGRAAALDLSTDGLLAFDASQRVVWANAAARRIWALEADWLSRRPGLRALLDALRHGRRLPERRDYPTWRAELAGDPVAQFNAEPLWSTPEGAAIRLHASAAADGGFALRLTDAQETLALERKLRGSTAARAALMNALPQGLAVFDANGRMRLSNPAFAAAAGLPFDPPRSAEEGDGPHAADLAARADADRADAWTAIRDAVLGGDEIGPRADGLRLARLPDGATLITLPPPSGVGRPAAADPPPPAQPIVAPSPIEQRRAEPPLSPRIAPAAAPPDTQGDAVRAEPVRAAAHSIIGAAEMLREGYAGAVSAGQREYLESILSAAHDLRLHALAASAADQPSNTQARESKTFDLIIDPLRSPLSDLAAANGITVALPPPGAGADLARPIDADSLTRALRALVARMLEIGAPGDSLSLAIRGDGAAAEILATLARRESVALRAVAQTDAEGAAVADSPAAAYARRVIAEHDGRLDVTHHAELVQARVTFS